MPSHNENNSKPRRRNWVWMVIITILLLIGGGVVWTYTTMRNTASEIYQPITDTAAAGENQSSTVAKEKVRDEEVDIKKGDPISILLLGMDSGGGRATGEMNTDVMILLTINPKTKDANMISIPRDTYSEYTGSKINAAYAMGGAAGSMNAVQMLLDVPVDRYALVDMTGIVNIVDAVGGITVTNDLAFSQEGYDFPIGTVTLDSGVEALAYMRNRYDDPNGDYGRNDRQREVLVGILNKFKGTNIISNAQPLIETVSENIVTDFTWDEMIQLGLKYRIDSENIYSETLIGTADSSTGAYLNILSEGQRAGTASKLRDHLGLE